MKPDILRFDGAAPHIPANEAWLACHPGELCAIAQRWFQVMRKCGDEVRELLHDGCPVARFGDVPFAYVDSFTSHVNIGFFQAHRFPSRLLLGKGKYMRHVRMQPRTPIHEAALTKTHRAGHSDIKSRVENG